jgi:septal ring factor EnvC (AmiA/AmiB activator)
MALAASIKVCDPLPLPASFLADISALRAQLERLRQDNERLQRELARAKAELNETRRASKRQAAPWRTSRGRPTVATPCGCRGPARTISAIEMPRPTEGRLSRRYIQPHGHGVSPGGRARIGWPPPTLPNRL